MHLQLGNSRFEWIDGWAGVPSTTSTHVAWAHNALCASRDGRIVGMHPGDGTVLVFDPDGSLDESFDCGVVEGHGLALSEEDGEEFLWIADCGVRMAYEAQAERGYAPYVGPRGGRVLKIRLVDGSLVGELPRPAHSDYQTKGYFPTAVVPLPDGGAWVADGYGASLLHKFTAAGELVMSISGNESTAGRLNCPHGLMIDNRSATPELYVADRENGRIAVFDLEGNFLRSIGEGTLARPSALAVSGDLLLVAELRARLAVLDSMDRPVGYLGGNEPVADTPGWPNSMNDEKLVRQELLEQGLFNSPHGLAIGADGGIYVSEWLIGGRYTKLMPVTSA